MGKYSVLILLALSFITACQKETQQPLRPQEEHPTAANNGHGHIKQTKTFSSDVAFVGNVAYSRHYAYSGIALYEAVVPGMPAYQSIASQLNGLGGLPSTLPGYAYHWAASANAALAFINKKFFPNASAANIAAMDSLEAALNAQYNNEAGAAVINRSIVFGKAVAQKIFEWSETDGYQHINDPYNPPSSGGQYWTPPSPLPVHSLPYFGNLRRMVAGSGDGAAISAPDYAALPAMTIEVINAKPAVGTNEYNAIFWWRDFPGTSSPGHYVNILKQVLQKERFSLDVAAIAYALGGITVVDISISTWQAKFEYLLARPFNYDDVIGQPFTPWITAPHPEYPAGHATLSAANAEAMTTVFGDNYAFTDSTFYGLVTPQGITLQPRSYSSFRDAGEEAGWSRLYGGIHFRQSIEIGFWQGRKVAANIQTMVKFLKDE
jgi:hypothetical protein